MNTLIKVKDTDKLLDLITKKGYSQRKLALACGLNWMTINRMFRLKKDITINTANKLIEVLQIDFDEFFEVRRDK